MKSDWDDDEKEDAKPGRKRRRKGGIANGMMARPRLDRRSRKPNMGGMPGPGGSPLASATGSPIKPSEPASAPGPVPRGTLDDDGDKPLGDEGPMLKRGGKTPNFHPGGEKGKLHREMGIPEGEKIPATKLRAATHSSDPEKRRDAIRAETMKKWHHGGSR